VTFVTPYRHKEKTLGGKLLMDAFAARLKDIKAAFSMRRASKNYMLYMYVDISQYFKVFQGV